MMMIAVRCERFEGGGAPRWGVYLDTFKIYHTEDLPLIPLTSQDFLAPHLLLCEKAAALPSGLVVIVIV